MKRILVLFSILSMFLAPQIASGSDFDDILEGMLNAVSEPTKQYIFRAGEKIYSRMDENLYYSGIEYQNGRKTLLLTLVENNTPILLKFPDPTVISVKEIKLEIVEFNNQYLKIRETRQK